MIGAIAFTLLTTWARGRKLMRERMTESALPLDVFAKSAHGSAARVPGTAIFMASSNVGVPSALLHNIKHNKVLHERVVVLTVEISEVPYVEPGERCEIALELGAISTEAEVAALRADAGRVSPALTESYTDFTK